MDCNNFKIQGVKANSTRCVLWAQVCNKQPTSQSDRCKLSPELNKWNNISLFTKPVVLNLFYKLPFLVKDSPKLSTNLKFFNKSTKKLGYRVIDSHKIVKFACK